ATVRQRSRAPQMITQEIEVSVRRVVLPNLVVNAGTIQVSRTHPAIGVQVFDDILPVIDKPLHLAIHACPLNPPTQRVVLVMDNSQMRMTIEKPSHRGAD